jgi:plastocyanin
MCGLQGSNDDAKITSCIGTKDGLTTACAGCYTQEFHCGDASCFSQCAGNPESAACSTCLDQSCRAALSRCTGLPPTSACADTADQTILAPLGNGALTQSEKCFKDNTNDDAAAQSCIQAMAKLSPLCAVCFDDFVTCTAAQCAGLCTTASPACAVCTQTHCAPAFAQCSGDPTVNGCDASITQTSSPGTTITFPMGMTPDLQYAPPCVKVPNGSSVGWSGNFTTYPLAGQGTGTPIATTSAGTSASFVFATSGSFGFHCLSTASMVGAVFVLP